MAILAAIGGGAYLLTREERKPSDSPSEDPIIKREREIKEEVLNSFSLEESKIETLLPQISYVGNSYSDFFKLETSLEEKLVIATQIVKNHKVKSFTNIPTSLTEFSQKFNQIFKEKEIFLILSFCPRKSDGSIDWLEFEKGFWRVKLDSSDEQENWNYLNNKVKIPLQEVFNNPANSDFPTDAGKVPEFLNNCLNDYFNEILFLFDSESNLTTEGIVNGLRKKPNYKFNFLDFEVPSDLTGVREKIGVPLLLPDWTKS